MYSPDGSRIAFADGFCDTCGEKDVWVMNADGSGLRQVTNTAHLELPHSWSHDGTRVAAEFVTGTMGKGDLAVVTVATGNNEPHQHQRHPRGRPRLAAMIVMA